MSEATVKLAITNTYEGGAEIKTEAVVTVPLPLPAEDTDERSDWADDHIFPETGAGRTRGNAWYDVEIVESSVPELLGLTFRFG
ncbi:hypothetical protein [Streptomyces sp. NRRL F-5123]|uniref:hypothetical protein n=1 Tax=Streptomyces sp. NRRL F-5123 TaxID=1463856 RepID=UPI0004E14A6B|nr:hypothetical protein [Streptomyces sp. NRRL F-5123]